MYKVDAVNFFGSKTKLAEAAGVKRSSVSAWGELVPEGRAARLVAASHGILTYDSSIYDAYRNAKRNGDPIHENQTRAHP